MARNILVTADFSEAGLEQLRELGEVTVGGWGVTGLIAGEAETAQMFAAADIVAIGYEPVTEPVFAATDLKYLASIRGGPGANIDLIAAAKRGIPVTGTVGREAKPVADHSFGLMLSVLRHVTYTDRLLRTGRLAGYPDDDSGETGWGMGPQDPWNTFKGFELSGKTLGLVGLGAVGREMVKRAHGFDMRVLAYDPYILDPGDVQMCSLDELLTEADVVSIHARVTEESAGMIGEREFGLMKPHAVLINTARAAVVSRPALIEALTSKRIRGAGLDVHHDEPLAADEPFLTMDNVVLTPHIAGATAEVMARHSQLVVDNIRRFCAGEPLVNDLTAGLA
jgi:D-3-phosphoglycerate dehydrogenase / 2-oxoglutarate reductase